MVQVPSPGFGSSAAGPCPGLPSLSASSPQQGCHHLSLAAARSWGSQHSSPHLKGCPVQFPCTSAEAPLAFPFLGFFPSTHKLQLSWICHTSSTNRSPPHVFSVHQYTDLVTVILFSFKMVNGFGLSFSPLSVQLSGLYKASIKQSFRHFCSLCTRVKCLKRCKIVKNQCGVFQPHSCLPISF